MPSSSQASSWTAILPEGEDHLGGCSRPPQVASGPETSPPWAPSSFVSCSKFPFLVPEEANRPGAWFCPTDHILSPSPGRTDPAASWGHRHVSGTGVPSPLDITGGRQADLRHPKLSLSSWTLHPHPRGFQPASVPVGGRLLGELTPGAWMTPRQEARPHWGFQPPPLPEGASSHLLVSAGLFTCASPFSVLL